MPEFAPEAIPAGLKKELEKDLTSAHFKEIVDKFLENGAQEGIRGVMDEVYKRLEGVPEK